MPSLYPGRPRKSSLGAGWLDQDGSVSRKLAAHNRLHMHGDNFGKANSMPWAPILNVFKALPYRFKAAPGKELIHHVTLITGNRHSAHRLCTIHVDSAGFQPSIWIQVMSSSRRSDHKIGLEMASTANCWCNQLCKMGLVDLHAPKGAQMQPKRRKPATPCP